jgi:hypothetical protein
MVPCRFRMNTKPTAYALVYQIKQKKDVAYARLLDLTGFHERVCHESLDFPALSFSVNLYQSVW